MCLGHNEKALFRFKHINTLTGELARVRSARVPKNLIRTGSQNRQRWPGKGSFSRPAYLVGVAIKLCAMGEGVHDSYLLPLHRCLHRPAPALFSTMASLFIEIIACEF